MPPMIAAPNGACPNWCNGNHVERVVRVTHRTVVGVVAGGGVVEVYQEQTKWLGDCGRIARQPYALVKVGAAYMDRLDRERSIELAGLLDACGQPKLGELLLMAAGLIDGTALSRHGAGHDS